MQNIAFDEPSLQKVKEIMARYPEGRHKSALLPVLHMAQERFGWLSVEVMDYVAKLLGLMPIEVYEVATFYTMFHVKPVGKIVLEYCHTGPCALRGAERVLKHIEDRLGIKVGETTPDGVFTIKTVECMASCGTGPMLQMGEYYYENLNERRVDELLEQFREMARQMPEHASGSGLGA